MRELSDEWSGAWQRGATEEEEEEEEEAEAAAQTQSLG